MDQIVMPPKTLQCGDLLQNINMALNKNFAAISDLITQEENEGINLNHFNAERCHSKKFAQLLNCTQAEQPFN